VAADLDRYSDVLDLLRGLPTHCPDVRVVVVSGSAVTGGYDAHSDLDVQVWTDGPPSATYDEALALVHDRFDVDHVWRVAADRWPTAAQGFIHLQPDAADLSRPTRLVDLFVDRLPERLTIDVRRHGTPEVLHDPDGLIHLEHDDEEVMESQRRRAVDQAAARRQTGAWLVERALARGDVAEAAWFHMRFAVEPLVTLLRIRHCPARHDFGLRYLRTDLPEGMAERVEALLPGPPGPTDPPTSSARELLAVRTRAAFAWQDEVLADLRT
jgi:hypothetical protein